MPAVLDRIVTGFYPEFLREEQINRRWWMSAYVSTYLERDVRNVIAIKQLEQFQTFLGLLATRAGGLLNLTEVGKECGISSTTAKNWLTVLQATYIVYLLRPYFKSQGKRLIKAPKLYFTDTGLLCHLLGIDSAERLMRASERGNIFENMVVMEAVKRAATSLERHQLFFYRTQRGHEVDLLIQKGTELYAHEIKFTKTPNRKMGEGLMRFKREHPDAHVSLLSLCDKEIPLTEGVSMAHWNSV